MFRLPEINFDRASFWIGFLAATLAGWIFMRVRPLVPQYIQQLREKYEKMQQRNLMGVEEALRKETLRRAQRQHLAAPLFSLDEVLISPRLIAPPPPPNINGDEPNLSIAAQVVPYLPDWTELTSSLGVPSLSVAQALENGSHIAVIGQPGMGKTVALADLASQIARSDISAGKLAMDVPLLMHILDLDTRFVEGADPLANLIKVICNQVGVVYQAQVPRLFQTILRDKQRRLLLILDGLDEVPLEQFAAAVIYLKALLSRYPRIQVITAAPADYLDGLTQAGFFPLGIAAWNLSQRQQFTHQWSSLWTDQLMPEVKRQFRAAEINSKLMDAWLGGETHFVTPLEWVLRVWGAFAGDISGSNTMTLLDGHIARFMPGAQFMPALEWVSHTMLLKPTVSLSFSEMEKIISSYKPLEARALSASQGNDESQSGDTAQPEKKARKKTSRRDLISSQGEQIIDALTKAGVLVEHSGGQIRFASPVFLGYLAGLQLTDEEASGIVQQLDWPVNQQALQYASACSQSPAWIEPLIHTPELPLCRNLLRAARWLREAPANADWRSYLMRTLVDLIQNENVPIATRARLMGVFYVCGDPSAPKFYKQLLNSHSPAIRRLALLACGATGSPQMIEDVLTLLADSEADVRYTACLALSAIPGDAAMDSLVEVLLQGDEGVRQAAAEALSQKMPVGQKVLEEAITVDDLLTRRASVFGLIQIDAPWARQAIERLAVEDGQWVVRNAAAQALETVQTANPAIPKPLQPASESSWLLTFASKLGLGILPDRPATDMLLLALKSGSVDEQITALRYLREEVDNEGVVKVIFDALYGEQMALRDPALDALWWMALNGQRLPSPTQFGLG